MPDTAPAMDGDLALFACSNPECDAFNRFDAGNLSVCERFGKNKHIRRLYCSHCQQRFSERRGSLMQYTKLPKPAVVRIVKCLSHGCSLEATADICQVDERTVRRMLEMAGRRAEDFHQLQLERLAQPPDVVELDELHARVCKPPASLPRQGAAKKGMRTTATRTRTRPRLARSRMGSGVLATVAAWAAGGFTWRWR